MGIRGGLRFLIVLIVLTMPALAAEQGYGWNNSDNADEGINIGRVGGAPRPDREAQSFVVNIPAGGFWTVENIHVMINDIGNAAFNTGKWIIVNDSQDNDEPDFIQTLGDYQSTNFNLSCPNCQWTGENTTWFGNPVAWRTINMTNSTQTATLANGTYWLVAMEDWITGAVSWNSNFSFDNGDGAFADGQRKERSVDTWSDVGIVGDDFIFNITYTASYSANHDPWFSWNPTPTHKSDLVTMEDLTNFEPGGSASIWNWDFGDYWNGTIGNETHVQNATYTYLEPGEYTITLNVTDNTGETNSTSRNITISGIKIRVFDELSPTTNISFNITITNTTDTYTQDDPSVFEGNFTWNNVSVGIPTGALTISLSSQNYESRNYFDTFTSSTYIRLDAFLIKSNACVIQPFIVRSSSGTFIENATIVATKVISGVSQQVGDATTDGTGSASMCLDPGIVHTITVTATGFDVLSTSLNPSTTTKLITLGTGGAIPVQVENNTFWVKWSPPGNTLNETRDPITVQVQRPGGSIVWIDLNLTNATGPALQTRKQDDPSGGAITVDANVTYELANLTGGQLVLGSVFIYINTTSNETVNHTWYTAGPSSNRSLASGLQLFCDEFSEGGGSILTLVIALAVGGGISLMFGFGGGLIVLLVAGAMTFYGCMYGDIFVLSAAVAIFSLLGKRWQ